MRGEDVAGLRAPLMEWRIATPRLDLRPLVGADAPALAEHLADPEVTRWLARVPHPYRLADAVSFVEQARLSAAAGAAVTFGLVLRERPEAGVVGVAVVHGLGGEPEFGYWLARDHWGRGLMGEAAAAVLEAVRRLPIARIRSGAFAGNEASLAIQRRNGFVVTGTSHRLCLAEGRMKEHVDTVLEIGPAVAPP